MTVGVVSQQFILSTRTLANVLLLAAASICVSGCSDRRGSANAKNSVTGGALNQPLRALKSASVVFIYEGLPHQLREATLLRRELKRTDITQIGGFSFYTPKAMATPEQAQRLKKILCAKDNYYIYQGEPTDCGPFHPDFAVAWIEGETEYQLLICFGCNEVQFLSNDTKLEYDLRSIKELKARLSEFKSKRPTE